MKLIKSIAVLILAALISSYAISQNPNESNSELEKGYNAKLVGGPCEGCSSLGKFQSRKKI